MDPLPKLLGLLLILQFGDVQGGVLCDRAGGKVVNGRCLIFNDVKVTWCESKHECASVGGRLAQFDDTYDYIGYINTTNHHGIWYAIGATYTDIEAQPGTWKWIDGQSFDPKPWLGGVKSNNDMQDWLWVRAEGYDDDDSAYHGGYICEITQPLTTAASTEETTRQPKAKYPYPYVCKGKKLIIECDLGYIIKVNNPSEIGQQVVYDSCNNLRSCNVPAFSPIICDPCEGTYNNRKVNHTCERPVINTVGDYELIYNLPTTDETEKIRLREIINDSIVNVNIHNELYKLNKTTYKQAVNQYSYLTYEEVISKITGAIVPDEVRKKRSADFNLQIYNPIDLGNEPDSLNWVKKGVVNPIRNQGECLSCWVFSTTSVIESEIMIKKGVLQQLSEQYLIDCNKGKHTHGCAGGWPSYAIDYVQDHGIALAGKYPYSHQNGPCDNTKQKTSFKVTKSEQIIEQRQDSHLLNANLHIGPISVCIHIPEKFTKYSGEIYDDAECNLNKVNHCLVLVGYGTEKGHKYWLLRNSWGSSWGENGYMKLSRNTPNNCHISTHAVFPVSTEEHRWSDESVGCIRGHNYKLLNDTLSFKVCKEKCQNEESFSCRSISYLRSTRQCELSVANRLSGVYFKTCHSPYQKNQYAERIFEHSWSDITRGCISGPNNKKLKTLTLEVCKEKCEKEKDFICRSVVYHHTNEECNLSTSNKTSGRHLQPCHSPYEYNLYAERVFDVKDNVAGLPEPGLVPGEHGWCPPSYKWSTSKCVRDWRSASSCPDADGYIHVKDAFTNKCFFVFYDEGRTWDETDNLCDKLGWPMVQDGDIVSLRKVITNKLGRKYSWLWIGADGTKGNFINHQGWTLTSRWRGWMKDEPKNEANKLCVGVDTQSVKSFEQAYAALPCNVEKGHAACEVPLQ